MFLLRPTGTALTGRSGHEPTDNLHQIGRKCPIATKSAYGLHAGSERVDRTCQRSGKAVAIDPNVWSGRALQEVSSTWQMRSCINVSGLCLERVLRAIM